MPQTITTTVYQLDELDEGARDAARSWYRQTAFDHDWFEFVYGDFEHVCDILGVSLKTRPVRLYGGGVRQDPCIWFSGFWSQGDGACFEGDYAYAKGAAKHVRAYAPMDDDLHQIADALQTAQRRNLYQLRAVIAHRGRYYHERTMDIRVERNSSVGQDMTAEADDVVIEAMRDLARWLYRHLEAEHDYLTSDDVVDEAVSANGYTFTKAGKRFG